MNHKLQSRLQGEISNLGYEDDTTLREESEKVLKNLLTRVEEESEKAGLKLNIKQQQQQKTLWREKGQRDTTLVAVRMEEGAMSQGLWAPPEFGKGKEFPLEPPTLSTL